MAPEPENGVSAWFSRAAPAIDLLNKIGFTTFLLIMVGLGVLWASGVIPLKPFDDMSAEHSTLAAALDRQTEATEKLVAINARMDRRAQLIDCARLLDPDLRKRCLE